MEDPREVDYPVPKVDHCVNNRTGLSRANAPFTNWDINIHTFDLFAYLEIIPNHIYQLKSHLHDTVIIQVRLDVISSCFKCSEMILLLRL